MHQELNSVSRRAWTHRDNGTIPTRELGPAPLPISSPTSPHHQEFGSWPLSLCSCSHAVTGVFLPKAVAQMALGDTILSLINLMELTSPVPPPLCGLFLRPGVPFPLHVAVNSVSQVWRGTPQDGVLPHPPCTCLLSLIFSLSSGSAALVIRKK